jgi:hypothetical protein
MITSRPATSDDYPAVAVIAAARTADAASSWSVMPAMDAGAIAALAGAGWLFDVSLDASGAPVAFAMSFSAGRLVHIRVAASSASVFYATTAAACGRWAGSEVDRVLSILPAAPFHERGWLDALSVVTYSTLAKRGGVPIFVRALCDPTTLQAACAAHP